MLGTIIGDICGSRFEWNNIKTKQFDLFTADCRVTDDSVMSLATAKALMSAAGDTDRFRAEMIACMQELGLRYPHAGYGKSFKQWIRSYYPMPYNSWGNGSAMRVCPCGWAGTTLEQTIKLAKVSAEVTHNHPEGIKGAEATAAAIYLARTGSSIPEIRSYIVQNYYSLDFTLEQIRPTYSFHVSCQESVPQAIVAFLESQSFEDAIRNAISIGGDSDTIAAICGGIAEAYYGIPSTLRRQAVAYLDDFQRNILDSFETNYGHH